MGAGTPENESGRAVMTRDLRSPNTSMSTENSAAENPAATTETDVLTNERHTDLVFDWGTETPVAMSGGDVVFVDVYRRTDDGGALRFDGDRPVATTSVYSLGELRSALLEAGYPASAVAFALDNKLDGETGRQAACIAESTADTDSDASGDVDSEIVTDGGVAQTTLGAGTTETDTDDTDEPDERPDDCWCRHWLGAGPCDACEDAGFTEPDWDDISVHDGGNREVGK